MQERDIGFQPNPKDEMNDLAVNGGVSKDEGAQQAEESVSREGINPPIFYVGIGASAGGLEALESFSRIWRPTAIWLSSSFSIFPPTTRA